MDKKSNTPKKIEEIRDFRVYGTTCFAKYSDMLLTVKDGKFDLKWFQIDFIMKDKFRFTFSPIIIAESTVDDVIEYAKKHEIATTPEPLKRVPLYETIKINIFHLTPKQ